MMPIAVTSVQAGEVNHLFLWVLVVCGFIFVVVGFGVTFFAFRFSS